MAAGIAGHRVACELIAAGHAVPLESRFQRHFTLSVDARAEADARARIADAPAIFALPEAARSILQTLRRASVGDSLAARIAG
jgi:hypothetical protein